MEEVAISESMDRTIVLAKSGRNYGMGIEEYSEIKLTDNFQGHNCPHLGVNICFRMGHMINEVEEQLSDSFVEYMKNPVHVDINGSLLLHVLKNTIEGQEFLELIISEYTDWNLELELTTVASRDSEIDVRWIDDLAHSVRMDLRDGKRWQQDEDELDKYVRENNPIGYELPSLKIGSDLVYTIRLLDEDWNHWIYVGESSQPYDRLTKHIERGGDFAEARRKRMEVIEVEDVTTDQTEKETYNLAKNKYDVPNKRICGGI